MTIDTDTPLSPGWWLRELSSKLERRQARLQDLADRYHGNCPLPEGPDSANEAYAAFQRKSRTNFAELIVEATRERMRVAGFRTSAANDDNGDSEARRIWEANSLDVESANVHATMLALGDAYVIVGRDEDGSPLITGEDPRQVITAHDPVRHSRVRAALKLFADRELGRSYAYLYLPGEVWVASTQVSPMSTWWGATPPPVRFSPSSWEWDTQRSARLPFDRVPVVRFRNKGDLLSGGADDGVGEFETHIDLLDRINHQILQRMAIATFQAFRQRVIENAPTVDENGEEIDWTILTAAPGALWTLPDGVKVWESGQVDLTPILSAVQDDLKSLSAVTRTPFHMLSPEGQNQSAEGASLSREGLVFKAEDRMAGATEAWKDVMSLSFLVAGDVERGDRSQIEVLWEDPQRRSLAELADAAVKKQSAGVPWRQNMVDLGYSLSEIDRMESDRAADVLLGVSATDAAQPVQQQSDAAVDEVDAMTKRTAAFGTLVRAGVTKESAAETVGLSGLDFLDLDPITLRDDEATGQQPPQLRGSTAVDAEPPPADDGDDTDR